MEGEIRCVEGLQNANLKPVADAALQMDEPAVEAPPSPMTEAAESIPGAVSCQPW